MNDKLKASDMPFMTEEMYNINYNETILLFKTINPTERQLKAVALFGEEATIIFD